ncbi:MAG: methylamine utilization protein [Melioribacteraceae bacterium]|nr:methylamine utilization protein [Melioribacteraceae bacterium]MCF8396501.1 methylamine utilization protein [Melioribacteraceae bacterium]
MNTHKIELISRFDKEEIRKLFFTVSYYLIAFILLFTGTTKLFDPKPLAETLRSLQLLSDEIIIFTSAILPVIEIGLGAMLLLKIKQDTAIKFPLPLFLLFFLFSVYGTYLGLENDCGCFGSAD